MAFSLSAEGYDPTSMPALTIAGIVLVFIVITGIIMGMGFYLFSGASGTNNGNNTSGFKLTPPKEYTVNIHGAFQSPNYKRGIYGLNIMSGLKSITENTPLNSHSNNTVRATILQKDKFKIDAIDLTKTVDSTYNSPYKNLNWLSYIDNIPLYKWKKIDEIKGIPDLYITEGGIFTEYEMKPVTELYFVNDTWNKDAGMIFVKMSFPNGKLPFNSTYENNTIATYSPAPGQQKYEISSVYGIPENSRLALVVQDKDDGEENIIDSFSVKQPVSRLYISGNKGITLIN